MDWLYIFLILVLVSLFLIVIRRVFQTKEYLSDSARNWILFVIALAYLFFSMDLHEYLFYDDTQPDVYQINERPIVSGRVMNDQGRLLLGAEVYFEEEPERKTITGTDGYFSFGNNINVLADESLHIHVSASGYREYYKPVPSNSDLSNIVVVMKEE
ncbi:MAG: hypothetical protein AAFN93_24345 [Bacteroidota bacterium]